MLPEKLSSSFVRFDQTAFLLLQRLKKEPHIEQYRKDRDLIRRHIQEPFKKFRDDLVVNWVLPNQLPFETERHVFSRLLKNDFGAGGCHHHIWLSFYRPGLRRLTDLQLAHSLSPDGFSTGLYLGENAPQLLRFARSRIQHAPHRYRELVNDVLGRGNWTLRIRPRKGTKRDNQEYTSALDILPESLYTASGIWLRTLQEKSLVLDGKALLVRSSMEALQQLWPVYLFLLGGP
jgi:hypothetical protein